MLGRANQRHEASKPTVQPVKSDLKKELWPSSSPSYRDGNIADFTKKGFPSSASSVSSKATTHPLNPRSDNIVHRPPIKASVTSFVKPTHGFSSLYSKSGSFKDEPVSSAVTNSTAKTSSSVYINEDDFSDDEALELDYACPEGLPVQPAIKTSQKRSSIITIPDSPPQASHNPISSTVQIPWTSSPSEHFYPPPTARRSSVKRESPEDTKPVAPVAKKRKLPASYTKSVTALQCKAEPAVGEDPEDLDPSYKQEAFAKSTPAAKSKTGLHWDTTLSATKEKKRQLKNQTRKSNNPTEYSTDEIKGATTAHTKTTHAAISLSSEQEHVKRLVVEDGQSVFFTGPAGTGKSVLMRSIIGALKKKWARDPERLSITASTGLAACNIGGQTLHSFAGIGLGKEDVPTLVKKIRRNAKAKNRWLRTRVLIIDEVSMVDGELFDKLSQIARTIRNNGRPWGNIQLVITGDFFQLPPVPDKGKRDTKFCFDAATWNTSIDHTIGLTQVFRQRDHQFAGMLNEMRLGRVTEETVQTFKSLSRPIIYDDDLEATELFPTRQEVERSNEMRLRNLPGKTWRFEATDSGDPAVRDRLLENMMAPKLLELKKGAQVMCIKNMDDTVVNGTLGKVKGFSSEALFHAWADKDGQASGDECEVELSSKGKIRSYSKDLKATKDMTEYPIVQFTGTDGSHRMMLVVPEEWKVELPNGDIQAKRLAVPLIHAWALSIHKAQGQTLERVKVDLGKVFEKGQAYVALSRATCKDGLQVLRFDKSKVMAHPRVIQFYNKLYSAESALKMKTPTTITDFAFKAKSDSYARKGVGVIDLDDEEEALAAAYG